MAIMFASGVAIGAGIFEKLASTFGVLDASREKLRSKENTDHENRTAVSHRPVI